MDRRGLVEGDRASVWRAGRGVWAWWGIAAALVVPNRRRLGTIRCPFQVVWAARTQTPAVRVSPRPMRLRRLSPAVRRVSQAWFLAVPR